MDVASLLGAVILVADAVGFVVWCALRARGSEWS